MRRSLAWNVIGVTVLVIVLMFTAGEVRFYSVNAGYTGEILRKHSIFSKLEAEQISARISEVASGLGVLARLQSEGVIAGDAETFSYLKSMLYMDKSADSVLLLDAGGAVVDAYPVQPGLSGIDMSNQEYYTGLAGQEGCRWSRAFMSPFTGHLTVTAALRMRSRIAVIFYNVDRMKDSIIDIPSPHSTIMLVDRDGVVITSSREGKDYAGMNIKNYGFVRSGLSGHEGTAFEPFDGEKGIVSVARIAGTEWLLTVFESEEDAFRSVRRSRNIAVAAMIALSLLLIAALAAAYRLLLRPIRRLSEKTQLVAKGESTAIPDPVYREFDDLVRNFEIMAGTVRKREEDLRHSIQEKNVLLMEVHDRVKNNLQVISSLLNIQLRRTNGEDLRQSMDNFNARIRSMALVHEQLYSAAEFSHINIEEYLQQLLRDIAVQRIGGGEIRVVMDACPAGMDLRTAVPFGLIANEALTNVYKHAYPEGTGGVVHVKVALGADGALLFSVRDEGAGFPERFNPSESAGMGLMLIAGLASQISADFSWRNEGGAYLEVRIPPAPPLVNG